MQKQRIDGDFIDKLACGVVKLLLNGNHHIATAESLTGGMISQSITSVSGSSAVFELGICSYSDRIKHEVLGVKAETLDKFTAVSENTAIEMARGVLVKSGADIAVSTTGIAGPTGATPLQPVGTVFVCVMTKDRYVCRDLALYNKFKGADREGNRLLTTAYALQIAEELLSGGQYEKRADR